jgi:hypothetical protein
MPRLSINPLEGCDHTKPMSECPACLAATVARWEWERRNDQIRELIDLGMWPEDEDRPIGGAR